MASHSGILAWRLPRTEKTGGLQSVRLHRVGHTRHVVHRQGRACSEFSQFVSPRSVRFLSLGHLSPFGQGSLGGLTGKERINACWCWRCGFNPQVRKMATRSSVLAWKIAWMEEPGGLQSVGSPKSQAQLRDSVATTLFMKR